MRIAPYSLLLAGVLCPIATAMAGPEDGSVSFAGRGVVPRRRPEHASKRPAAFLLHLRRQTLRRPVNQVGRDPPHSAAGRTHEHMVTPPLKPA